MNASTKIDTLIAQLPEWQADIYTHLRQLIHHAAPDIVEDWQWHGPAFSHPKLGGLVCRISSTSDTVSLIFFQGALLVDHHSLFDANATGEHRAIQIGANQPVHNQAIIEYVQATINPAPADKPIAPEPEIILPPDILDALAQADLLQAFADRPYYQRKLWPEWITVARHTDTRQRRLATMLRELTEGTYMAPKPAAPEAEEQ